MDEQLRNLLLIYFVTGLAMFITVLVRTYRKKDFTFMKYKLFECDLWCVSHFMMYLLLGYYSPKYWTLSSVLSILWEYFEVFMEKRNVYILSNVKNDIITNSLGLFTGIILTFT